MTSKSTSPFDRYPDQDIDWCEDQWNTLLQHLVDTGLVTWHQIGALVLGHLNPSQIGTSIASNKSFQKHFPKRKHGQQLGNGISINLAYVETAEQD